ncbi:MAG: hypothetical protein ACOXZ6_02025 [Syntrophomonadaceae bacterium]
MGVTPNHPPGYMFDVYTPHLNIGVIFCAALLAGGASIKSAK